MHWQKQHHSVNDQCPWFRHHNQPVQWHQQRLKLPIVGTDLSAEGCQEVASTGANRIQNHEQEHQFWRM